MGLIFHRNGKPYVLEAVSTVRFAPLDRWIARGTAQHFVVRRLEDADSLLTAAGLERLRAAALQFEAQPYDLTFEWSDTRI